MRFLYSFTNNVDMTRAHPLRKSTPHDYIKTPPRSQGGVTLMSINRC
jgi:hypothetical protein